MCAEIINLRAKRKEKIRSSKAEKSSENRVLYGQSKTAKIKQAKEKTQFNRKLDGAKRDKPIKE